MSALKWIAEMLRWTSKALPQGRCGLWLYLARVQKVLTVRSDVQKSLGHGKVTCAGLIQASSRHLPRCCRDFQGSQQRLALVEAVFGESLNCFDHMVKCRMSLG